MDGSVFSLSNEIEAVVSDDLDYVSGTEELGELWEEKSVE